MITFLFALISAIGAVLGGALALGERKRLHLTLGFTAGALLGLVAFDLLPEIFEISQDANFDFRWPMVALASGFLLFHTIEKSILLHHSQEESYGSHKHPKVGILSAVALIGHSFLDGMSIGLAFQINKSVGIAVGVAVIAHRFADGFNSINLMLFNKNTREQAKKVLAVVAIAPFIGAVSTIFYTLPQTALALYLGFFAGFLLYIGASDILPQAHSKKSSRLTILFTVLGVIFMYFVSEFAHSVH